jgi:uncharacterized protein (DUF305 family)
VKQALRLLKMILIFFVFAAGTTQTASDASEQNSPPSKAWPSLMQGMAKMDAAMTQVKSSGDDDADFVRLMLPHHQAAIDMAKSELLYGHDPQMRRLAQEIVTDQQSEIELMRLWMKQQASRTKR